MNTEFESEVVGEKEMIDDARLILFSYLSGMEGSTFGTLMYWVYSDNVEQGYFIILKRLCCYLYFFLWERKELIVKITDLTFHGWSMVHIRKRIGGIYLLFYHIFGIYENFLR